eukprot:COSAG02_NODE_47403_length_341_cov_0.859504_1_plen_86_part_01
MSPCDRWAVDNNCGDDKASCSDMGSTVAAHMSCQCVESDNDCTQDGGDDYTFMAREHCPCTPDGKSELHTRLLRRLRLPHRTLRS